MKKLFAFILFAALLTIAFSMSGCLPRRPGLPHPPRHAPHHP